MISIGSSPAFRGKCHRDGFKRFCKGFNAKLFSSADSLRVALELFRSFSFGSSAARYYLSIFYSISDDAEAVM